MRHVGEMGRHGLEIVNGLNTFSVREKLCTLKCKCATPLLPCSRLPSLASGLLWGVLLITLWAFIKRKLGSACPCRLWVSPLLRKEGNEQKEMGYKQDMGLFQLIEVTLYFCCTDFQTHPRWIRRLLRIHRSGDTQHRLCLLPILFVVVMVLKVNSRHQRISPLNTLSESISWDYFYIILCNSRGTANIIKIHFLISPATNVHSTSQFPNMYLITRFV